MSTLERIQDVLVEEYALDRDRLGPDAELTGLGVDSLALVELLFQLEDRFGLKIEGDPPDLRTVGDVVAFVDAVLAGSPPGSAGGAGLPAGT